MKLFVIAFAVVVLTVAKSSYEVSAIPSSYGYHGPPAPLAHDGTVLDTPEVAQAKAAHLAAHAAASARAKHQHGYQYEENSYNDEEDKNPRVYVHSSKYTASPHPQGYLGPPAPLAHDGRVVDTAEVAQAKAAHLAAHVNAASRVSHYGNYEDDTSGYLEQPESQGYTVPVQITYNHPSPGGYQGPFAPLGQDGRVIDTPEVAQARAAHLQAYAHAASLLSTANINNNNNNHGSYNLPSEAPVHEPSSAEGPSSSFRNEGYY